MGNTLKKDPTIYISISDMKSKRMDKNHINMMTPYQIKQYYSILNKIGTVMFNDKSCTFNDVFIYKEAYDYMVEINAKLWNDYLKIYENITKLLIFDRCVNNIRNS